jgi:hypothetical protein
MKASPAAAKPSLSEIVASELRRAQACPNWFKCLVLIPLGTKVGGNFASALSHDIKERLPDWFYEPARPRVTASFRTYALCCLVGESGRFLAALRGSLEGFGMLRVAQIYAADPKDGVLRRVIVAQKTIGGGRKGGAR